MEDHVVCVGGKKIFASDETCCFHDDGCPMHDLETAVADREIEAAIIRLLMDFADCRCDNPCHPDCCPVCNPPAAQEPASQNADA